MQRKFGTILRHLDGETIMDRSETGEKPMTLGHVAVTALLATFDDERHLGGQQKLDRYVLATKIHSAKDGVADLTAEEVSAIKTVVGKAYPPLVVGQAFQLLDADPS
jgi:hypothetical protein